MLLFLPRICSSASEMHKIWLYKSFSFIHILISLSFLITPSSLGDDNASLLTELSPQCFFWNCKVSGWYRNTTFSIHHYHFPNYQPLTTIMTNIFAKSRNHCISYIHFFLSMNLLIGSIRSSSAFILSEGGTTASPSSRSSSSVLNHISSSSSSVRASRRKRWFLRMERMLEKTMHLLVVKTENAHTVCSPSISKTVFLKPEWCT